MHPDTYAATVRLRALKADFDAYKAQTRRELDELHRQVRALQRGRAG